MRNETLRLKVTQRVNKLSSQDYDNIECWAVQEAFNKAQVEWCRRQLPGTNLRKEGDEQSTRRIDDLNILLKPKKLLLTKVGNYYQSQKLPILTSNDYMAYKRIDAIAKSDCCPERSMVVYLVEEGNIDVYLSDECKKPSFAWGETLATIYGNRLRIYVDDFEITEATLNYYRQPRAIQINGCGDINTGLISTADVLCEFKDDIAELFVDLAASVIAADLESQQAQRLKATAEENN